MEEQAQESVNLLIPLLIILVIGSIAVIVYYSVISGRITVGDRTVNIPRLSSDEQNKKMEGCDNEINVHQQDWCYLDIAKNQRIDSCSKITNNDLKLYCEAIINEKVSSCDGIFASSVQDACYMSVATILKDIKICEKSRRVDYCRSLFN